MLPGQRSDVIGQRRAGSIEIYIDTNSKILCRRRNSTHHVIAQLVELYRPTHGVKVAYAYEFNNHAARS